MTTEQLQELAQALSILSAKSSVLAERDELRELMEENMSAEEVRSAGKTVSSRLMRFSGHPSRQAYTTDDQKDRQPTIGV